MIRDGNHRLAATHAVLAATVTYSPLFSDFLGLVVRDRFRRFGQTLKPAHWDQYLADCPTRDPQMPEWTEATRTTLRTRAFGMLREAGYLSPGKSHEFQPP